MKTIKERFTDRFGQTTKPVMGYFAPGRVNLIGDHTDYTGGFVLPCALDIGTTLCVRLREDPVIRLASDNFQDVAALPKGEIGFQGAGKWFNYPLGIMDQFLKMGFHIPGMELLFSGDIPFGAGLSSSASIEMVTAFALNDLLGAGLSMKELVLLARRSENEFIGVNCGIMDMFVIGFAQPSSAIFLNCSDLGFEHIPLPFDGCSLVITDSKKVRGLADSKYNERVAECQQALLHLQDLLPVHSLAEVTPEAFNQAKGTFRDEVIMRRARHVVLENQRVKDSVLALEGGDLERFGSLMYSSHQSLKNDYEVTGFELDTLVEEAMEIEGVIGSRMTGAGFGGCTVSLVRQHALDDFYHTVKEQYHQTTGLTPAFYVVNPGSGVRSSEQ